MRTNPMKSNYQEELADMQYAANCLKEELIDARGHGDLSENAEYSTAQHDLRMIMARISELEKAIEMQEQHDLLTPTHHRVEKGATVYIKDLDTGEVEAYTFVAKELMDPLNNLLSTDCQLFKCIQGMVEGNTAVIHAKQPNRLVIEHIL